MARGRFSSPAIVTGSLIFVCVPALAAPRRPAVPTAWNAATPMPLGDAAIGYAHAQCDTHPNSFYVISGANERIALTTNAWRYDADTDTWNALAPIPHLHGREGLAAVCHQGSIYVAGGAGYAVDASHQLFIYDVANDTWSAGADIPRNVFGAAMGAFGGQIYLMGGDDNYFWPAGLSNEVDIYDVATNTWTNTGAPMPAAAHQPGWAQVGQYLYVVGGYADTSPSSNVNVTQRYDMSANTWTIGPTFTSARAFLALAATSQFLYAMGGDPDGGGLFGTSALVERLDHTAFPAGAWTDTADPLPQAMFYLRGGFCTSAIAGGEVWALNGIGPFPLVQSANLYRPAESCPPGGTPAPVVVKTSATLTAEGCGPPNGSIDPGETVTVDFALRNIGSAAATNVVATLQASGGVTPITTSQTYGALPAGGPPVSQPFTFSAAGACGGTITATLAVQDGATNLGTKSSTFTLGTTNTTGTATFSNPTPITIPGLGQATTYPSDIAVSGMTDTISKVTVTLNGLSHGRPNDVDILLVGPNGRGMVLMSDAGGTPSIANVTITLDDDVTASIPIPIVAGTYWPYDIGGLQDPFNPPAPAPPPSAYGNTLSFFNGIDPNGTWSLYVMDDTTGAIGSIAGGWSITITTAVPACCQGGPPPTSRAWGYVVNFALNDPGTMTVWGSAGLNGGVDFDSSGSFGTLYGSGSEYVWNEVFVNFFVGIDTATGSMTTLDGWASAAPDYLIDLAGDPVTGQMYGNRGYALYTIDTVSGLQTFVGPITPPTDLLGIAIQPGTGQMYGYDPTNLMLIDKTTGARTIIGPLGFSAGAGGMDFDDSDGTLYLFAYNQGTGQGELRTADLTSGATTLMGPIAVPGGLAGAGIAAPSPIFISIGAVTVPEGNGGTTAATFSVTLTPPDPVIVHSVDFATSDGTATVADGDYVPVSGALVFGPGQTSASIVVNVVGDTNFEPPETFLVALSNGAGVTITDGQGVGTIVNDDAPTPAHGELIHSSRETRDLATASRFWRISQKALRSYEVVVDAVTGDIGANGPDLLRLASDGTVLQSGSSATGGSSKRLRFSNASSIDNNAELIWLGNADCGALCDANDTFRVRAYDTTYQFPRFNNSATQVTVVIIVNPTDQPVTGTIWFHQASTGNLLASQAVVIEPKASFVLNTPTLVGGQSGTATFSNDAPYGALTGKAVAVEPATGFTFDTAMVPRMAAAGTVPWQN